MIATILANTVITHRLDPDVEIENVRHELDLLFTRYLLEYRRLEPA